MRPQAVVGVILIAFGAIVLAMRGISYTKDRESVEIGPVEIAAEEKGFIPPVVGVIALVAGLALVLIGPRRSQHS
jgi:hypothetical protein